MKDYNIWNFISSELETTNSVILILTADTKGSSAGKTGFKCAVSQSGKLFGTVGGGAAELKMIQTAKEMLHEGGPETVRKQLVHNPNKKGEQSGMICSGNQTFILQLIDKKDKTVVQSVLEASQQKSKPGILSVGNVSGINFNESEADNKKYDYTELNEQDYIYKEQTGKPDTLYIIGGGHVGAAVSDLFRNLDFKIKVFDARPELKIFNDIKSADEKIITDYGQLHQYLKVDDTKYIVIMTAQHSTDQTALEQALTSDAAYIGMLGSKAKKNEIYRNLIKKGISQAQLNTVFCPVGVPIKANTPAEIAISIAAEIIDFKNKQIQQ